MKFNQALIVASLFFLFSCINFKKGQKLNTAIADPSITLDTLSIFAAKEPPIYQSTTTRKYDIIHTKLDVTFDWKKCYLYGKATIKIKPYFNTINTIVLDAKGMDINEVTLNEKSTLVKVPYNYNKKELEIDLTKLFARQDTFTISIDYTAKPNEIKTVGSSAITSDKGLYFINPEGKEKNKPMQIWTQGETESNSCWFPTFDHPNEKMTTELFITVDTKYTTLSNGELVFQTENENNTRTDYWRMDLPHAPYLVMMAIGEYAMVKDKWNDKEVNYYVEKKYEPYAKAIFGNTPEMLTFFSEKLKTPFPWNKYSQIVVRDYVSGAMENTTATVHGEFMQRDTRELLDKTNEDVVSHELFHQWFGDLVTTESWSNLPLNESFATYGEYLWIEYKYGKEEADHHLNEDLQAYLNEASRKQVEMIRFFYDDKEDMFDAHSYQKGGRILHLLRNYVGDDAFFESLHQYLDKNKFSSVEIHQLRLAFEEVTGEDLNWFFNQWFFSSGHPELEIFCRYDTQTKKEKIRIKQIQNTLKSNVFKLPISIDFYVNGKVERKKVVVSKTEEEFSFDISTMPDLVNVDAEKILLGAKIEQKSIAELAFQYRNAPLFMDRYEAVKQIGNLREYTFLTQVSENIHSTDSIASLILLEATNDKHWSIRSLALSNLQYKKDVVFKNKLIGIASGDKNSTVRANALKLLSKSYAEDSLTPLYTKALQDRSYAVVATGLLCLHKSNKELALKQAESLKAETNTELLLALSAIYADGGTDKDNSFYLQLFDQLSGYNRIPLILSYSQFLENCTDSIVESGSFFLTSIAKKDNASKLEKLYVQRGIKSLIDFYSEKSTNTNDQKNIQEINYRKQNLIDLYNTIAY